jgi:hypothetical protein
VTGVPAGLFRRALFNDRRAAAETMGEEVVRKLTERYAEYSKQGGTTDKSAQARPRKKGK